MRGLHYEWSLAAPMTTQLRGRCSGHEGGGGSDGLAGRGEGGPEAVVFVVYGKRMCGGEDDISSGNGASNGGRYGNGRSVEVQVEVDTLRACIIEVLLGYSTGKDDGSRDKPSTPPRSRLQPRQ